MKMRDCVPLHTIVVSGTMNVEPEAPMCKDGNVEVGESIKILAKMVHEAAVLWTEEFTSVMDFKQDKQMVNACKVKSVQGLHDCKDNFKLIHRKLLQMWMIRLFLQMTLQAIWRRLGVVSKLIWNNVTMIQRSKRVGFH